MKKIAIANVKGGCGKTTIATSLSCLAAMEGEKVLLIDADIQNSSIEFREHRPDTAAPFQAVSILTKTIHKDINAFDADFVFIDVGGKDSDVFRSALMAVDSIIIPITPSQYDIWSTEKTFKIVQDVRAIYEEIRPIKVAIALNQVISGTSLSKDVKDVLDEYLKTFDLTLLPVFLYSRVAYKESVSEGLSVCEMKGEKYQKANEEMMKFYKEVQKWA